MYAVVLAAGQGERFGGSKLLAPWRGRPLLWHALAGVRAAVYRGLLERGCVVIPDSPALEQIAREAGLTPVTNPQAASGLGSSIRAGVEWLAGVADAGPAAAMLFLGDQPAVPLEVVSGLIGAWDGGKQPVVRPRYAAAPEEPGHPIVVDRSLWDLARELTGDAGFGPLFTSHQVPVFTLSVPGRNPDVDTPGDLSSLEGTTR